ncbi:MAG: DNA mismatch repair protein MutS [Acholeplasmataceae bacterium]
MVKDQHTPMIKQYLTIKEDYADAIVFFRLGDFYEMFFDDAVLASNILDITLTSRHKESNIPMCGVPYHSAAIYIQKLIKEGMKVAIAEQVTPPGNGLVKREVTRLITPGTVLEDMILDPSEHNFISGIHVTEEGVGFAYLDMSTGEGFVSLYATLHEAFDVLKKEGIKEVVSVIDLPSIPQVLTTKIELTKTFNPKSLKPFLGAMKEAIRSVLFYISETQQHPIDHIPPFESIQQKHQLHLDAHVLRHLDVFESASGHSLYKVLNHTHTAMGSRYLKRLISTPLMDIEDIEKRHAMIEAFQSQIDVTDLFKSLKEVYDMYRLTQRFAYHKVTPKDVIQLRQTLSAYEDIKHYLSFYPEPLASKAEALPNLESLNQYLNQAIVDDPPTSTSEGGYIKAGFDQTLDEFNHTYEHFESWLDTYLESQKTFTGLKQLKIGHHRVFGYFLEITKGQMQSYDESWGFERKQTLKNSERFTTPELRAQEQKIIQAQENRIKKETEIFEQVIQDVMRHYESLLLISQALSEIDVFSSLAKAFQTLRYVKPRFNHSQTLKIRDGRHPVIEQLTSYVHNDCHLEHNDMLLMTGPNMSGKSTYMRMIALIVLMAQVGFFVPASEANVCIYDGIFTRIGASDDIASGQSTFMMEMLETNEALRQATSKSLLIFDEIGRGTATYDGMALAQGILEYIHHHIQAHTLFSTHYHELTSLDAHLKHLINVHVTAKQKNHEMIFLHQVKPGKSDKSYGIQVAALANLPTEVISRSQVILKEFESIRRQHQFNLFTYQDTPVEEKQTEFSNTLGMIDEIDINHLTPLEALSWIQKLKDTKHGEDDE